MKTSPIVLAFLTAVLLVSGAAHAGKGQGMGQGDRCEMIDKLELTGEQKEKMQALHDKLHAMRPDKKQARPFMQEHQAIVHADTFDEAAAKALIAKQQQMQAGHKLEKMRIQHQMYQLLTPEQREQWQAIKQKNKGDKPKKGDKDKKDKKSKKDDQADD